MRFILLLSLMFNVISFAVGQTIASSAFNYEFNQAYVSFPSIPKGILEGVAYAQTRIQHLVIEEEGCVGLPAVYGVMGLTEDGEGYFNNNLELASQVSGYSAEEIKSSPQKNIFAYAALYNHLLSLTATNATVEGSPITDFSVHENILRMISEIPQDGNPVNDYALSCFTFEVLRFMNDPARQAHYNLPNYSIDFLAIYGSENYSILTSSNVTVEANSVTDENGNEYAPQLKSLEYAPALWVATPSCNYSSRSGTPISAVTVHTIQGSYAGAISWAQNCSASVSYHYVARSSDGQITQMVYEANKAWHVGSENPYTIGIEHEGYVSNPAWYTEAMYVGSANLVKDICNSGYGINPLRTFQGPATSGSNVLGGCTKIKGHQHYPNQTHTDPGIYWNWEHYYQLINDSPAVTNYTAGSGSFYDSGGAVGNYSNDERKLYLIQPAGVVTVTISFASFNLENNWDYLYVYDGSSTTDALLGVFTGSTIPSSITSTGPEILIEFRSDCATVSSGWQINWTSVSGPVPGDVVPPSTLVTFPADWKTANFPVTFTDTDNSGGSGVGYQLYQVIDFDGTEWRANADLGFFSDNFDAAIHPDWTSATGTWSIIGGYLNQSDEANGNTNLYASLNQDDYNTFLYHWAGKIGGTGTNKRVGFHFMCDDATLPNRGNSYFVWFREDDNKVQIYEVVNDVFTLMSDVTYTLNANQWYDFKTSFDKTSGAIKVWINDVLVSSWVDTSPYTSGNAISFRSGNATYDVNDLKIYHERGNSELVTIGTSGEVRYQNVNPTISSAKIKSIVVDNSSNISSVNSQLANVDWTSPADVSVVSDGTGSDIGNTTSNTELSANWPATTDPHSDVVAYWYAIGTSPGATDVVNWTDNWFNTSVTHSGLSLTYGTTYYVSVKAENGAGLFSDPISSDGQQLILPVNPPVAQFSIMNTYVCSTDSLQFTNSSVDATDYSWSVPGATPAFSTLANPYFQFPVSGTYEVTLTADGPGGTDSETQLINVEVLSPPVAAFTQSTGNLSLDYPFVTFSNNSINANGYFWDFGDGNGSSDTDPWHAYSSAGNYTIMMIAVNGTCPNDTAWSSVEVIDDLSTLESGGLEFEVYPNPAHDVISISITGIGAGNGLVSVALLDSRGRIVLDAMPVTTNGIILFPIDSESIAPGIYFVHLKSSQGSKIQKVMIK